MQSKERSDFLLQTKKTPFPLKGLIGCESVLLLGHKNYLQAVCRRMAFYN